MSPIRNYLTWTAAAIFAGTSATQARADITQSDAGLALPIAIDFEDAAPGIQTGQEWRAATGISFHAVLLYTDNVSNVAGAEGAKIVGEAGAEVVAVSFDAPQSAYSMVWSTNPGLSEVSVFLNGALQEQALLPTTSVNAATAFLIIDEVSFDRIEIRITPDVAVTNSFVIDSVQVEQTGTTLGEPYCAATPNSFSAEGASIAASGSTSLADGQLTLSATGVPPGAGLFVFGQSQVRSPLGNGSLCVGGQLTRLPVVMSANGVLEHAVDVSAHGGQMAAWGKVNFQAWFRDASAGGAGFNLSDALQITFQP